MEEKKTKEEFKHPLEDNLNGKISVENKEIDRLYNGITNTNDIVDLLNGFVDGFPAGYTMETCGKSWLKNKNKKSLSPSEEMTANKEKNKLKLGLMKKTCFELLKKGFGTENRFKELLSELNRIPEAMLQVENAGIDDIFKKYTNQLGTVDNNMREILIDNSKGALKNKEGFKKYEEISSIEEMEKIEEKDTNALKGTKEKLQSLEEPKLTLEQKEELKKGVTQKEKEEQKKEKLKPQNYM